MPYDVAYAKALAGNLHIDSLKEQVQRDPTGVIAQIGDYLRDDRTIPFLEKSTDLVTPTNTRSGLLATGLQQAKTTGEAYGAAANLGASQASNTQRKLRRNTKKAGLVKSSAGNEFSYKTTHNILNS